MLQTFLIVDDAPVIRMMLKRMLEKSGIAATQIEQASDGAEAVEIFEEITPDIVFMDMEMPGMDGATASLKIMMKNPDVKLVLVTGLTRDDERVKNIISMGAFDIIQKPVREADLRKVLNMIKQDDPAFGSII